METKKLSNPKAQIKSIIGIHGLTLMITLNNHESDGLSTIYRIKIDPKQNLTFTKGTMIEFDSIGISNTLQNVKVLS